MTTITAQRPDGTFETIDVTERFPVGLNDTLFARMQQATREAGRGELLSYANTDDRTPAELAWSAIERLIDQCESASDRGAHADAIKLANQVDAAIAQWRGDYPAEAAERLAAREDRLAEMRSTASYRAMSEMRD